MRSVDLTSLLLAPLAVLAIPTGAAEGSYSLAVRQGRLKAPPPCVMNAAVTETETAARFEKFADAFIVKKNITEAFEHIAASYIACAPPPDRTNQRKDLTLGCRTTTQRPRTAPLRPGAS